MPNQRPAQFIFFLPVTTPLLLCRNPTNSSLKQMLEVGHLHNDSWHINIHLNALMR
jgi:hypothetical protein